MNLFFNNADALKNTPQPNRFATFSFGIFGSFHNVLSVLFFNPLCMTFEIELTFMFVVTAVPMVLELVQVANAQVVPDI